MTRRTSAAPTPRAELIADTAIALLAERGLRGLTHRAVDEAAGLPQGSTSNHARTRAALLETTVRRLAVREARVLTPDEMPPEAGGTAQQQADPEALAGLIASALHRYLAHNKPLLVARYELALEATRRPELRAFYDRTGAASFGAPLNAMLRSAGSTDPRRHTLMLLSWCDGVLFSCTAGTYSTEAPTEAELRASMREMLTGMLGATALDGSAP
ncbi:TetR/AcrR family transcriptional regulator [Streptomyces iconiensis]|uniref:TetR family transcriptional regulator n=1 Tax=Streptomyces iconiensis TaxID=1384038 RepID=A0ABT7A2W4_9ACTN|nr:TetR/AcrR family transcriptional regulator [Streptomyces iconiensis]MDJ1135631.1 TetR family transcriptional regulator [Streptomyces iconiensis]